MIDVLKLGKYYNDFVAIDEISFSVGHGEVLGFLGPNGAGKTTTMRILTGFMKPSSGSVTVNGVDVLRDPVGARQHIGYLPENNPLPEQLKIYEYLQFVAKAKQLTGVDKKIKKVVGLCDIGEKIDLQISELSKGWRQRVGLAAALLGEPSVLVLDEPTSGLDPNQALAIRQVIKDFGRQNTVLFSSHILKEVEATCDRAMILDRGKVVARGRVDELMRESLGQQSIRIELARDADDVELTIGKIPAVSTVTRHDGSYIITSKSETDLRPVLYQTAVDNGWTLLEMQSMEMSLEEIFRHLTNAT